MPKRRATDEQLRIIGEMKDSGATLREIEIVVGLPANYISHVYQDNFVVKEDDMPLYDLQQSELPLVTSSGTWYKMPVTEQGESRSCLCKKCVEEKLEAECRALVMNGDPIRCNWPLVSEVEG